MRAGADKFIECLKQYGCKVDRSEWNGTMCYIYVAYRNPFHEHESRYALRKAYEKYGDDAKVRILSSTRSLTAAAQREMA